MNNVTDTPITPRIEWALAELKRMIAGRFPTATFAVQQGFDPCGIHLVVTVDIDDTDEVVDVVGDRLVDMQVDEGLPVYVVPLRPIERVVAELRLHQAGTPAGTMPIE